LIVASGQAVGIVDELAAADRPSSGLVEVPPAEIVFCGLALASLPAAEPDERE
jgi:hypothetical protein